MVEIQKSDVEHILQAHKGNNIFERALNNATSDKNLIALLGAYVQFNSVFAPGVASLAGEIGVRQDIFREKTEPIEILGDRSAEVAAKIFFAAIDEYARRITHRMLAQKLLKSLTEGYDSAELNAIFSKNFYVRNAMTMVKRGYEVNKQVRDWELFKGMGFHMGSEILADNEFIILNNFLQEHFPGLVKYLEEHQSYAWVKIHTTVEAEHFESAVAGANLALKYYCGERSPEEVKHHVVSGLEDFSDIQTRFMKGMLEQSLKSKNHGGGE